MFCVNMAVGVFFVLTLHLQLGLGFSPLGAALTVVPATLGIVIGNVVAMRTSHRGRVVTAVSVLLLPVSLAGIAAHAVHFGGSAGVGRRRVRSGNTTVQLGTATGIALFVARH